MVNISKSSIIYQYRSTTDRLTCQNVYQSTYQIVDISACPPSGCLPKDLSDHRLANLPTIFTWQPVDMSTRWPVNQSNCQPVNPWTCQLIDMSTLPLIKLSINIRSINNKILFVIRATGGTVNTPLLSYLMNYIDNNFESLRKNYLTLELLLYSSVHDPKLF